MKAQVPFCRLWGQYQIYVATINIGVSIVVKCGHYDSSSTAKGFIESSKALAALANTIDVEKESSTTFEADKITLIDKVRDFTKMTDKLNRVLRAAEAACGDSTSTEKKPILILIST